MEAEINSSMPSHQPQPVQQIWQTVNGFRLHWRLLEDQYVVYNSGSGHTHILDPVAALIVHKVIEKPSETGVLIQQVAGLLGLDTTAEVRGEFHQTLANLKELGLLEAVSA